MRRLVLYIVIFTFGVILGGIVFSQSLPRSVFSVSPCNTECFRPAEIAGLLMSAGISLAPGLIPGVVAESNKCIGIQHWKPEGRYHVVFFPKRDVRNIMELELSDMPYLFDCLALARNDLIAVGYKNYRFISNGPALQHVTYFHFHVIAK